MHESTFPNGKIHEVHMGPIWGRQHPGGPHVGPMNCGPMNMLSGLFCDDETSYTSPTLTRLCDLLWSNITDFHVELDFSEKVPASLAADNVGLFNTSALEYKYYNSSSLRCSLRELFVAISSNR